MPDTSPLKGIRIQIAGSVPKSIESGLQNEITRFVELLTRRVLSNGGTVIHGSSPSFMEALRSAGTWFGELGGPRDALCLVRSEKYAQKPEEVKIIEDQRLFAAVHVIPFRPGNRSEVLIPMREWMAERCDAVVAVGGNLDDYSGEISGPASEVEEVIRRGKPAFIVAGFGGAVQTYAKERPTLFTRLKNGMTPAENLALSGSVDVEKITDTIVSRLSLLPLTRESVPSGRLFRILTLDGGGLRGAFTAAVLARWAEMLGPDGGKDLIKHFDLVAGTSTGAILAIGLGLGLTPKQILDFYVKEGPKIFPKGRDLRHWLKSKHDSTTLKEMLESIFGDHRLSRYSCCRLVIPTVRARHGESETIVTAHTLDRVAFRSVTAVEAALASSAAPTYFDEAWVDGEVAKQNFLDGGIWANNPVLPAVAEAVRHLKVPLDRIDVLSVGTMGNETDFTHVLNKGKAGWAPSSADLFFASQEHAAATLADALLSPARHLRVNQLTPSEIKLDDIAAITDMVQRGANVGQDAFIAVRSRFLDGFHAKDWRTEVGPH